MLEKLKVVEEIEREGQEVYRERDLIRERGEAGQRIPRE